MTIIGLKQKEDLDVTQMIITDQEADIVTEMISKLIEKMKEYVIIKVDLLVRLNHHKIRKLFQKRLIYEVKQTKLKIKKINLFLKNNLWKKKSNSRQYRKILK